MPGGTEFTAMSMGISAKAVAGALFGRAAFLAGVWWILAEGAPSWAFGMLVILFALGASLLIAPPHGHHIRLVGLVRFAVFFLRESLRGGVDVALRALHPRLPLAPALLAYDLRLAPGPARIFMVNVVSLLPGTLSADLSESGLSVHVLDRNLPVQHQLQALEQRVAMLFGVSLSPGKGAHHG